MVTTIMSANYKRDRFVFVSNLNKKVTCDPDDPLTLNRDAYLLSERYSTRSNNDLALYAKSKKNTLISDNGNFTRIKKIASEFEKEGKLLLNNAKNNGVSAKITKERKKIFEKIVIACEKIQSELDLTTILKRQMACSPDFFIGAEDFTIPTLQLTQLFHPKYSPKSNEIIKYQSNTKKLFVQQSKGVFGEKDKGSLGFLVIHAFNYSTARQAAVKIATNKKINAIAISYGAPMLSHQWLEEIKLGRKKIKFHEKLPEKYIVAQSLSLGVARGLSSKSNRKLKLHLLGVGTPIMLVLSAVFLKYFSGISLDSSSPVQDAKDGSIYGSRSGFIKMKMYKLAARLLIEDKSYESRQPYWKRFNEKYPSNWSELRKKLNVTSLTVHRDLEKTLRKSQELVRKYIPYFTILKGGSDVFYHDLRVARAGGNYYVLQEICKRVRSRADDQKKLNYWVEKEISRYKKISHPKWAKAVEEAYLLSI